jgi:hypothetical protein
MLVLISAGLAKANDDKRVPNVPPGLEAPAGHKVSFRAFAEGVQIYTATLSPDSSRSLVWTFVGPEAVLLDSEGGVVGCHYAYAGPARPAWESSSGSLVVGARNVPPVTVDPTALAWLRLDAVLAAGPGIFKGTTFIQRVNTTGGLPPATAPTRVGEEARVPYTAEYVFYRAKG